MMADEDHNANHWVCWHDNKGARGMSGPRGRGRGVCDRVDSGQYVGGQRADSMGDSCTLSLATWASSDSSVNTLA